MFSWSRDGLEKKINSVAGSSAVMRRAKTKMGTTGGAADHLLAQSGSLTSAAVAVKPFWVRDCSFAAQAVEAHMAPTRHSATAEETRFQPLFERLKAI